VAAFSAELDLARGADPRLDKAITAAASAMQAAVDSSDPSAVQSGARVLVEQLATTLQACLLMRFAPEYVSEAFVATRLNASHGRSFGTLPSALVGSWAGAVIERTFPL
jgi:putative acyl-CoA dehydrogenase